MNDKSKRAEICRYCGKTVRIYVPAGGDGSADVYMRHNTQAGIRCVGSRQDTTETRNRRRFA